MRVSSFTFHDIGKMQMPQAPTLTRSNGPQSPELTAGPPPTSQAVPDAPKSLEDTKGRKAHPALQVVLDENSDNFGESTVKLTAIPADFDVNIHQQLRKKDFKTEDIYFEFRAEQAEAEAKDWRSKVETFRKFGDAEQRKAAMKYKALASRIAELREQLKAANIDVSELDEEALLSV